MNNQKMRDFTYFLFNRFAAGHEPTASQFQNALSDFEKQQLPKRTTEINNRDKRKKPLNIVTKQEQ